MGVHAKHADIFECVKAADRAVTEAAMSAHGHRLTVILRAALDGSEETSIRRALGTTGVDLILPSGDRVHGR